jgi:hypothetical protein
MVDTFRPLMVTETAMGLDDESIINPGRSKKICSNGARVCVQLFKI